MIAKVVRKAKLSEFNEVEGNLKFGCPRRLKSAWQRWSTSGRRIMEFYQDFKELLVLLDAHRVDYVIVGAYALGFHGCPGYAADLDLLV